MSSMDNAKENLAQDVKQQALKGKELPVDSSHDDDMRCASKPPYYNQPTVHPNFDPKQTPLDPDRPLTDIPSPVRREQIKLDRIYDVSKSTSRQASIETKSAWDLLVSPSFASHLELLQAGGLIKLPSSFFKAPNNSASYPLLPSLSQISLIDTADIYKAVQQVKQEGYVLTRYGVKASFAFSNKNDSSGDDSGKCEQIKNNALSYTDLPEMINDVFAPDWELILYPENFDNGVNSLETDILACSVAVHVLKQCNTRKTINTSITTKQICQHMRSYLLSQCRLFAQECERYRQVRLFEGHVIVAAKYLGIDTSFVKADTLAKESDITGHNMHDYKVYLNVSSRNALFVRYPNMSSYYINGWQ